MTMAKLITQAVGLSQRRRRPAQPWQKRSTSYQVRCSNVRATRPRDELLWIPRRQVKLSSRVSSCTDPVAEQPDHLSISFAASQFQVDGQMSLLFQRFLGLTIVLFSLLSSTLVQLQGQRALLDWRSFVVPDFGTSIQYPANIFAPTGKPEKGVGHQPVASAEMTVEIRLTSSRLARKDLAETEGLAHFGMAPRAVEGKKADWPCSLADDSKVTAFWGPAETKEMASNGKMQLVELSCQA
jgi:hypothetical protein